VVGVALIIIDTLLDTRRSDPAQPSADKLEQRSEE